MYWDDVTNLFGLDIRLRFNADMVQVEDGNPSKAGIQVLPGEFPVADFEVKNVVDNEAGTIWYAVTQLNPREPVSGSGRRGFAGAHDGREQAAGRTRRAASTARCPLRLTRVWES